MFTRLPCLLSDSVSEMVVIHKSQIAVIVESNPRKSTLVSVTKVRLNDSYKRSLANNIRHKEIQGLCLKKIKPPHCSNTINIALYVFSMTA